MATNTPPNDDTPNSSSLKTSPDRPIPSDPDALPTRTPRAVQERADLDAAKGAASILTEQELRELKAWIEMISARRDGF